MGSRLADLQTGELDLVVFKVGGMACALTINEVQEIKRLGQLTRVHHAPEYVRGVVNLRGQIVTVIDLRKKLKCPNFKVNDGSRIVVVSRGGERIGLLVDSIEDAVVADAQDILETPSNIQGTEGRFFLGVYKSSDALVAILDLEVILEKDRGDPVNQTSQIECI